MVEITLQDGDDVLNHVITRSHDLSRLILLVLRNRFCVEADRIRILDEKSNQNDVYFIFII